METDRRVRLCLCYLRVSVRILHILEKELVLLVLRGQCLIRKQRNATGVTLKNSSMKIKKTTSNLNAQHAQQAQLEDTKTNASPAKAVESTWTPINSQNVKNVLQMHFAHSEQNSSSP